jgi:hypothetical protein
MATKPRSPEQIRASIEQNRMALVHSVDTLRGEIVRATDWRGYLERNRETVVKGSAAVGLVVGGIVMMKLLRGRR